MSHKFCLGSFVVLLIFMTIVTEEGRGEEEEKDELNRRQLKENTKTLILYI